MLSSSNAAEKNASARKPLSDKEVIQRREIRDLILEGGKSKSKKKLQQTIMSCVRRCLLITPFFLFMHIGHMSSPSSAHPCPFRVFPPSPVVFCGSLPHVMCSAPQFDTL